MKLSRFLSNKKPVLDEKGIAHFFVPLLVVVLIAIVGTFMVVSSNANPISKKNAAAKKETASKIGKGYLFVYGDGNSDYTGVQIQAVNMDTKAKSCGPAWKSGVIQKKFPEPKVAGGNWRVTPAKFNCSATNGTELYSVNYMKGKLLVATQIAVDIDAGYCTAVNTDGSQVKVKYNKKENACGSVNVKKITKATPSILVQPSSGSKGKKLTGWVSLIAPAVTKKKCTGQVKVTVASASGVAATRNLPLKYVNIKDKPAYCVAKLNISGLKQNVNYNVRADFAGSIFFHPAANGANITLVKAAAASNGTGGTPAPGTAAQ